MTDKCARPTCQRERHKGYEPYCQAHAFALGHRHHRKPATEARTIIQRYLDAGFTHTAIAKTAGITHHIITGIARGTQHTIRVSTLAKLRNIGPLDADNIRYPAWPVTRRLQALRAAGKHVRDIADGTGLNIKTITYFSLGQREWSEPHVWDAVMAYYEKHQMDPVHPAIPKVRSKRWTLPMGWDDIDDPTERRDPLTYEETRDQAPITPDHADAVEYLLTFGGMERIGEELGISHTPVGKIRGGRGTAAREILRRVIHLAQRRGWTSHHSEIAA